MSICTIRTSINRVFSRNLHLTLSRRGTDAREKRSGHIKKTDTLEGERGAIAPTYTSFELIDENLMDRLIDNVKFKDIPILHLKCTRNNTKMTLTRGDGAIEMVRTAGAEGYLHCRKGTTVAAQAVANRIVTYARDVDIKMVRLVFDGLGPGRGAAYKVIELSGIKVVSLSDRTEAIEPWINRPRAAKSI